MIKKRSFIKIFILLLFFLLPLSFISKIFAEGTYSNIGTPTGTNAGPDAVSWPSEFPIIIDIYGNRIVSTEAVGGGYTFAVRSNNGTTWNELSSNGVLTGRPTAVYDSRNDKIHVLIESINNKNVVYKRLKIIRNQDYSINSFVDDGISLTLDSNNCQTVSFNDYPLLLWKDDGANGILAAFWSVQKTCNGTSISVTRGSMRILSNTSADSGNWSPLNGVDDTSTSVGPANVPFNDIYRYNGFSSFSFMHSAFISNSGTSKGNDIYYFNTDENSINGFRRLTWNTTNKNWSNTWTTRTQFGGATVNASGYIDDFQLMTKPVYDSYNDRVYIGIARWLDNINGDTQSLYSIDASDSVSLTGNIYSAKGAAWFAPTMDISYDQNDHKVYTFFETSSIDPNNSSITNTSFDGKVYYKTYDGSSFSNAQAFFTLNGYTVDIPVVYQNAYNNRLELFFRVDGSEGSYTPPHNIYSGYISANGTITITTVNAQSSPYTQTTYSDFTSTCDTKNNTFYTNQNGGEITLKPTFIEDFETPLHPYNSLSGDLWRWGIYESGTYNPVPNGTLSLGSLGGNYVVGNKSFTQKTLEFKANFAQRNWEHAGFANDENFSSTWAMFSTFNQGINGHLFARTGGVSDIDLGTGYLNAYHLYKIDWNATSIDYYIDNVLVSSATTKTTPLSPIFSYNDTVNQVSPFVVDWVRILDYPTNGSYDSCIINSGINNAKWGNINYSTIIPAQTSLSIKTRTSNDGINWSSYSSNLNNSDPISNPTGQYIQYHLDLTGTSITSPTLNDISLNFSAPITPSITPTITQTFTPIPTGISNTPTITISPTSIPLSTVLFGNNTKINISKPVIVGNNPNAYRLSIDNNFIQTNIVPDNNGNWSFNVNKDLSNGTHTITLYDKNGSVLGVSTINVDTLVNTGINVLPNIIFGLLIILILFFVRLNTKKL